MMETKKLTTDARQLIDRFYIKMENGRALVRIGRLGVGIVLQALREERGWSFREAADIIGCDASSLSKLEKGQKWNDRTAQKAIDIYLG